MARKRNRNVVNLMTLGMECAILYSGQNAVCGVVRTYIDFVNALDRPLLFELDALQWSPIVSGAI